MGTLGGAQGKLFIQCCFHIISWQFISNKYGRKRGERAKGLIPPRDTGAMVFMYPFLLYKAMFSFPI
jgi:hypothetical protein